MPGSLNNKTMSENLREIKVLLVNKMKKFTKYNLISFFLRHQSLINLKVLGNNFTNVLIYESQTFQLHPT